MQQRRDEIMQKKAKLAELKRQRELRATQASSSRQSIGSSDLGSPSGSSRADSRRDIDSLINSLVGDGRAGPHSAPGGSTPMSLTLRGSRPNSVLSAGDLSTEASDFATLTSIATTVPVLTTAPLTTVYEMEPQQAHDTAKEVVTYSKAVQTTEEWSGPISTGVGTGPANGRSRGHSMAFSDVDDYSSMMMSPSKQRLSRREREREEELRQNIRREIEQELKAAQQLLDDGQMSSADGPASTNFPARALSAEELEAVMGSEDFLDFVEHSSKVIERALDQEYDILMDYALQGQDIDEEDDGSGNTGGKGRHKIKEIAQFYDERWSKKRMVSGIDWSPKFPELFLASYTKNPTAPNDPDGLVQVWNMHLHDRPEFVFHAQSDVLTAKFSPFHPNLIVGGSYSGQVLLWDTRAKSAPVQKTPLTGHGHTHPVYSVDIVGTQNANNIISCSTDGVVCAWSMDVFAQPQELLELKLPSPAKLDEVAPACLAFPQADPTFFLVGTEESAIYPCHRYDRAGAKAGIEAGVSYRGHHAPVMSVDFHPARGPVDLGDLVLSSSLDWSVKLWRVRAPAATSTSAAATDGHMTPLVDFVREDVVYDARWSPLKPGVFGLVDGAGWLELWDITVETEEPVARISPSSRKDGRSMLSKSLNKLAWEKTDGKRVATGGIDGTVTVFEVGNGLGGKEELRAEEWTSVKKLVNRIETMGVNGVVG
ncbi:Cytoplasmic dynein 1 intermediate chain 2 [Ceratocystis lukuohia]|uniref:Cytoplasmic dynein 1 intermediate chain 2 n=1 Tax=Ceratocystis lukuohia TaxID=2019550 RepID=A0ABR4MP89_9PEZI